MVNKNDSMRYFFFALIFFAGPLLAQDSATLNLQQAYDLARPGRPVTVLYSPRNPRRAVIYEFCGYGVRDREAELLH